MFQILIFLTFCSGGRGGGGFAKKSGIQDFKGTKKTFDD